jgi:hypothetical protein
MLNLFLKEGYKVSFLDVAPEMIKGIGGKFKPTPQPPSFIYLTTEIFAPRLTAKSPEERDRLAQANAISIERMFEEYRRQPSDVLFINDVSIYLQAGDLESLWDVISLSKTAVMNGYYGKTLGEDPLSQRERREMDRLIERCDRVIWL